MASGVCANANVGLCAAGSVDRTWSLVAQVIPADTGLLAVAPGNCSVSGSESFHLGWSEKLIKVRFLPAHYGSSASTLSSASIPSGEVESHLGGSGRAQKLTSVPHSGDRLSHTLRRAAVNCHSHSGNSSVPAECQMLFTVHEVAFWPSPVHSDCPPPPTHLISTLTPSWPFGDCPKTERHTPWLTPRCLWPREFYDISKRGEKPGSGVQPAPFFTWL